MTEQLQIQLRTFCESDLTFWEKWNKLVDFSIYQTHLFPQGFTEENTGKYLLFIIEAGLQPVGAIWLEEIDFSTKTASLGLLIGDPGCWNKRIGSTVIRMVVGDAFGNLGLESINLNVRETNHRAIRCYEKVGFKKCRYLEPRKFVDGSVQGWFEMVVTLKNFVRG